MLRIQFMFKRIPSSIFEEKEMLISDTYDFICLGIEGV
jgi:hypothetical protein